MSVNRRELLKAGVALPAIVALPSTALAEVGFDPQPAAWRRFQVITRVDMPDVGDSRQAWVPEPAVNEGDWLKSLGNEWTSNGCVALVRDPKYGAAMLHVTWSDDQKAPFIEVTSQIATRDRAINFTRSGTPAPLAAAERTLYTQATDFIPIDGVVKETSDRIVANASAATDLEKARAIYEWVVDNTFRDAKVRGCGIGDIAGMLKTGNLGGKCADINALYVGLARAAGVPARDLYGIRVAPSRFGYKSLGVGSETITKAQHCRAEVFLTGFGWVPTDAADVRKVILEEPPQNLAINDRKVVAARKTLFGAWEGNWVAYNVAHDVALEGSQGGRIAFLMYPQAECANAQLDCLDPDRFTYTITAHELTA